MESMPVKLNSAEQGVLSQLDQLPSKDLQGQAREYVANNYFVRNGFTPLDGKCASNCFDGVYVKGNTVYVNEVKPLNQTGSISLNPANGKTELPTQQTDEWVQYSIGQLRKSEKPELVATANVVEQAWRNGNLVKLVSGVDSNGMVIVKIPRNVP